MQKHKNTNQQHINIWQTNNKITTTVAKSENKREKQQKEKKINNVHTRFGHTFVNQNPRKKTAMVAKN